MRQNTFRLSGAIGREAKMMIATKILPASNNRILKVEKGGFLKRVRGWKFQCNIASYFFILKLRVANYKLNLKRQFSKTFAESDFETSSC